MATENEDNNLHLLISVGGVTIEVEGPVDDAEAWFETLREDYLSQIDDDVLEAAAGRITEEQIKGTPADPPNFDSKGNKKKSKSLAEYYKETDNPTKQESALIVGWYLEYHEDQDNFTSKEIEHRAQDAKISLGANVARDLREQVGQGHLKRVDERDGNDAYYVTRTGEAYIEEELLG